MSHESFPTENPAVVTCGLPYANGDLHVGHLRTYVGGDAFARALETLGQQTAFVSGSDMHGTPVAVNAWREGVSPEEFALRHHEKYEATFPKFDVEFDNYGHTGEDENIELTQRFVSELDEGGHIYEKEIEVAWDPEEDQPLPDRYVEGTCPYCGEHARGDECDEGCGRHLEPGEIEEPTSIITGNPAEYRTREHKFLRLSEFQDYLGEFIDRLDGTANARNQPREWIEGELQDWCITRDLDWGIEYPGEEDLVLYVWVDAPIEYVASTKQYTERVGADEYDWEQVWQDEGEIIHVIGRDIIQHHTVFWPAVLHGVDFNEPRSVLASGFVNLDGKGFSTSRNRAVWADEYLDEGFDTDLYRYYVTTGTGFQQDVDFSWERFAERVNGELVGTLGNFCYRSLLFAHRNYDGTPAGDVSEEVTERIEDAIDDFAAGVDDYSIRAVGQAPVKLAQFGNEYIQGYEPWNLDDPERGSVIRDCIQLAKAIAVLAEPVMPSTAERLWNQLGESGSVHDATLDAALEAPSADFDAPEELFAKIDDDRVAELNEELEAQIAAASEGDADDAPDEDGSDDDTAGTDTEIAALADERIGFEAFQDLDIRVGEIELAEGIEGADDLARLEVDLGVETRQVVAGIKQLHDLSSLAGTRVVVLANIEKNELFGVESNGMVLAAGEDADLLTTHDDSVPGTKVR
ncbi:methionine--tRNA ligase [Halococcus saccharolyticus]|uniref:Methionine--tRNA ligase n=1 Tax=Halococcus saccharolyticus DSM 5350 TaxID=1227455 RepID=M0MM63_9EURY|nr:methionine--tRNA ligase [Halococcus saccharolyticus]EMA46766.1 methionyl-tRNA ligase [Halococcus saccharolyticus DSM 5350]